ncbi:DNA mismatch repair protein MutS [Paenisporosarcina antarctica]|uniref:DNA mismatch repair protein MutS n=1 Tax=Paenisporosarcina antarctica TaxID=417367 RepID=A0A4P7A0N9_9BACL|nr:DNA mismatch repair protein MutS [Paenisporosarcina antarctica]QBP41416.1 DNA mismatch repair protein MutS [Paenisporosarcina antarctica]
MNNYTPMIQQYLQVKSEYADAFLFFRLGDFYELFFEDAIRASQILEITLTSRAGGSVERIPMCGVPHHAAQNYIETLIQKGYRVAICEQTEDPKQAIGVVKREVVRLITPGTIIEGKNMDGKTNHFIASAEEIDENCYAYAYLDLSTGEGTSVILTGTEKNLIQELQALSIRELVVPEQLFVLLSDLAEAHSILLSIEETKLELNTNKLFVEQNPIDVHGVCHRLVTYLHRTQKRSLDHIQPFKFQEREELLTIDFHSKRNLELVQSIRGGDQKGSLYWLLDETMTAMGGRKLKQWLHQPLANRTKIEERLEIVTEMLEAYFIRADIRETLKEVYDLERLIGRISFGTASGRDLSQLRQSLIQIPLIKEKLKESAKPALIKAANNLDECLELLNMLKEAISDHPPLSVKEGDIIRDGFHARLDELRYAKKNGKDWISALELKERERTGIKGLKIGYNRIFGYYIEITKSNIHLADLTRYERKQTLANAERYITDELKEKESLILTAEEESLVLEYSLFVDVREQVKQYIPQVQKLAAKVSELDVFSSFAEVTDHYRLTKPTFHDGLDLTIVNGRHPVVEKMMNKQHYVPNDCVLSSEENMLLITGPNMSGKSTFMRQVAITVIMGQMGCYVPAEKALLPVTDQIFTRIGAADDLAAGQSTFMVEMLESTYAITHATERSLLLFDEIGRGTSTYDGMALAQAMMEYIHTEIRANTLFSTHYHELTQLEKHLDKLRNVHVAAIEQNGKVVFLHKVKSGPADKSYGIHVAELAQLPEPIIVRAREILQELETVKEHESKGKQSTVNEQLTFFQESKKQPEEIKKEPITDGVLSSIREIDITGTTPMKALQFLYELQQKIGK